MQRSQQLLCSAQKQTRQEPHLQASNLWRKLRYEPVENDSRQPGSHGRCSMRSTDSLQKWKNPTHHQVLSTVSKFPKQRMVGKLGEGIFGYFAVDMSGPAEIPWLGCPWFSGHWASSGPRTPSALIYGLYSQQVYTLCGFVFIALLLQELVSYLRHINLLGGWYM